MAAAAATTTRQQRLKLLVLSELDGQILRVNRLSERLVSSVDGSDIDAILVSGGFVAPRAPREYEALEAVAAAEGDMMALVSRLEMIVCRVVYIPDDVCTCLCVQLAQRVRIYVCLCLSVCVCVCVSECSSARECATKAVTAVVTVCTVLCCALHTQNDPPTTRSLVVAPPTLTQYSVNIFSRAQPLAPGVVVMGEAQYFKSVARRVHCSCCCCC